MTLTRRTALTSRTELKRTPFPPRSKPLESRSTLTRTPLLPSQGAGRRQSSLKSTRTVTSAERHARTVLDARSGGICEYHGNHAATDYSHRIHAKVGGPWDVANAADLCHWLHMFLHDHRTVAQRYGLILKSHQDFLTEPVWLPLHGGWVRLTSTTEVIPCPEWGPAPDGIPAVSL